LLSFLAACTTVPRDVVTRTAAVAVQGSSHFTSTRVEVRIAPDGTWRWSSGGETRGGGTIVRSGEHVTLKSGTAFAVVTRRRRTVLDEWPSRAVPPPASQPHPVAPVDIFEPDLGIGGSADHHGNQRPLGGYGSDVEQPRDDDEPDRRSSSAA
jgi:hypothetical protein